jgi:hypothetical protein
MAYCIFEVDSFRSVLKEASFHQKLDQQPEVVKNAFKHVHHVHNDPRFLAVCGSHENKKKQGAFQSSLNTLAAGSSLDRGIEDCLQANFCRGVDPFSPEEAQRMAGGVVALLRDHEDPMATALRDVSAASGGDLSQAGAQRARYEALADEVVQLYDRFHISHRT